MSVDHSGGRVEITRAMVTRVEKRLITDVAHRDWAQQYFPMPDHKTWRQIARDALEAALNEGRSR